MPSIFNCRVNACKCNGTPKINQLCNYTLDHMLTGQTSKYGLLDTNWLPAGSELISID